MQGTVIDQQGEQVVIQSSVRSGSSSSSSFSFHALIILHYVPLVLQMLLEALILFTKPQQDQPLMVSSGNSLADDLGILEQAGQPAQLQLGFEQYVRAGSFKGRVELQVVHTTQQGAKLFAGLLPPRKGAKLSVCMLN